MNRAYNATCETMPEIPDGSIQTCVTSPPYYGLRDYDVPGQIGLEETLDAYVARIVGVFREVRRTLRDDGTAWLNLGDSYASSPCGAFNGGGFTDRSAVYGGRDMSGVRTSGGCDKVKASGLKPKDLIGVPWSVAFALRADGWWLRDAIVWCLSPSTRIYARTQKGDQPATLHDLVRLNPSTVQLWNGQKWTQVLGWGPTRCDTPLCLVLRSGERIGTTPNHEWPTADGRVVRADALKAGDVLRTCALPEPDSVPDDEHLADLAWFAGLYLAEGSRSQDAIQIAGHCDEVARMDRVDEIARRYGGSSVVHIGPGNSASQVVHGAILEGALRHFVGGRIARDKHLHPRVWEHSNAILDALLRGYLASDGHDDPMNLRWRIGFTRNDLWANDLRTIAARLGLTLTLQKTYAQIGRVRTFEAYRGEIRFERSCHWNEKERAEILAIEKSPSGEFIDVSVEDTPHLFALASGVLTHNCKPNPMPSSVKDRCTPSYEMVFLLAKSARYYYDADAIREPHASATLARIAQAKWKNGTQAGSARANGGAKTNGPMRAVVNAKGSTRPPQLEDAPNQYDESGANKRNVWTIATTPYADAHFATFPRKIPSLCIRAGSRSGDVVLDPFLGSGTTAEVAESLGRQWVGYEINPAYCALIAGRTQQMGLLSS